MNDLVREARSCPREEFARKHPGFYLVPMPRSRRLRAMAGTVPNMRALSKRPTENVEVDAAEQTVVEMVALPSVERPLNVGRTDDNDVILSDPTVSRRHAAFLIANGRIELVDLGSRNGTRVRGIALRAGESQRIAIGDDVRFGSINLVLADASLCWDALNDK
jgi:hypothetical protein